MDIDACIDELDDLLAADDETALALDEVHGFMSAALCGPRVLSFSECLCALVLHEEEDETGECELPARLIELLGILYEGTQRSIEDGSFVPVVTFAPDDDAAEIAMDARQWCCGFLLCVDDSRTHWNLEDSRVLELLTPIVLLADESEFEQAVTQLNELNAESLRQELLESLPESVCAFKKLFKKNRQARRPVRTAAPPSKKRRPGVKKK
jgi:yecA family protein